MKFLFSITLLLLVAGCATVGTTSTSSPSFPPSPSSLVKDAVERVPTTIGNAVERVPTAPLGLIYWNPYCTNGVPMGNVVYNIHSTTDLTAPRPWPVILTTPVCGFALTNYFEPCRFFAISPSNIITHAGI
jgi:hypothetical protein